jgi:hypothetical protein
MRKVDILIKPCAKVMVLNELYLNTSNGVDALSYLIVY